MHTLVIVVVYLLSCLFSIPWTIAFQAPLSMEFSRQEYWSGLLFPSAGDLPDPGRAHMSCIARQILYCWATMEALSIQQHIGSIISLWFLLRFWIRACQSIYQIWRQKGRVHYSWGGGTFVVEESGTTNMRVLSAFREPLASCLLHGYRHRGR